MKHLLGTGLVIWTLSVIAAQCGAAQSATEIANPQTTAPEVGESTSEVEAGTESTVDNSIEPIESPTSPRVEAVEESRETTEQGPTDVEISAEQEMATETDDHPEDCEDPFTGISIRFSPRFWTADGISRFVRAGIVDPNSDLATNFCVHSVDFAEIISGGPPPDGIPPLDNPTFDTIAQGDAWLADVQPVIALAVAGEAKAYPLAILTRHEIANDEIAGIPVAVTFCPLCNAGIVFNREVDGEVLRFGVSGNLRNSDLIMWDNKTLSWWQQFTGEAIVGELTGTQLEILPAQMVSWRDFKEAYPDGKVLSTRGNSYGRNPYVGYDSSAQPFLFLDTPDPRLPATDRVLGYFSGDTAVAYPLSRIAQEGVIEDMISGQNIVIFYEPGQVSALDQSVIEQSKEVGSAGMFIPAVDGQALTFSYTDGVITDNETGSEWDVFGRAISGKLANAQLEPVLSHTHFWFAWAAFRPDTIVYGQ